MRQISLEVLANKERKKKSNSYIHIQFLCRNTTTFNHDSDNNNNSLLVINTHFVCSHTPLFLRHYHFRRKKERERENESGKHMATNTLTTFILVF